MKVIRVILMDGKEVEIEVEKIEAITVSDVADEVPVPEQPTPVVAVAPDVPAPAVMEEPVFEDVPTTSEETVTDTTDAPVESLTTPVGEETPVVATTPVETVAEEQSFIDSLVDMAMTDAETSEPIVEEVIEEKPVEEVPAEEPKEETAPTTDFVGA